MWVPKNAEFYADLKSVEKVAKRLTWKKLEGRELLHTALKDDNIEDCTP